MRNATFACPDLTTFCRVDELGLVVIGQRLEPGRAVLARSTRRSAVGSARQWSLVGRMTPPRCVLDFRAPGGADHPPDSGRRRPVLVLNRRMRR